MTTVLITGASSGIGRATAQLFAERGWNVVATMRTPDVSLGTDNVLVTRLDVADCSTIDAAVSEGIDRFGGIDVVVNNAGFGQYGVFESVSRQVIVDQFEVNVFGVMEVIRAVLPHLRAKGEGTIVNVSSGAGLYGLPMTSIYCASKFALEGFSEALSYELGGLGIAVKLVIPHGGVGGTSFPGHTDLGDAIPVPEYDEYAAKVGAAMARMPAPQLVPSEDVAATIFEASTDGSDRLRYLVGNDVRGFIEAWGSLPRDDYAAFMRSRFDVSEG
jgi:NAD(P)-dependent dehydrogenase (short-subunit alcohol dehydrogenase family)